MGHQLNAEENIVQSNQSKSNKTGLQPSRRQFIKSTAATGAAILAPTVIPASVLGLEGATPPSEKILMGGIGIGRRGSYDLRMFMREDDLRFLANCDPQKSRREEVKKLVDNRYNNMDCELYADIDEFLAERTDLDAVLIATGDRWHALASIKAMRAGKDVYTEKPSCMTIQEGQEVVKTAKRYGRVYQTGTQRLSEANFTYINELLKTGRLGEVNLVRAHIAPWDAAVMRHDWLEEQPLPPRNEVNWDAWLGPCPWRPYNEEYTRGGWRGHYDFHTSCIGEWGAHTFAQCQFAIGATDEAAVEYIYVDNPTGDGMTTTFNNGVKMILQLEGFDGSCGVRYEGTEGWAECADGYEKPKVSDEKLMDDFPNLVDEYVEETGHVQNHWRDFLNGVKERKEAVANPMVMHTSMTTVHAANICMWLKRDMEFDPNKEEFVNDDEANRLRVRAQREPWIM